MTDDYRRLRVKVTRLLAGTPIRRVRQGQSEPELTGPRETLRKALQRQYGKESAEHLAFHLMDWTYDAAFLLAVAMYPERFSAREIRCGVDMMLVHVPNHVAAAAKISEYGCADVWNEIPASRMKKNKRPILIKPRPHETRKRLEGSSSRPRDASSTAPGPGSAR